MSTSSGYQGRQEWGGFMYLRQSKCSSRIEVASIRLISMAGLAVALSISVAPALVRSAEGDAPGRGLIRPPFEIHRIDVRAPKTALPLPVRFDWREYGAVTSVKDQGSCGACFAFGLAGDLESKLLIGGGGGYDLSENNIKECEWFAYNGYSPSSCRGGTFWRAVNLVAAKGSVLEACDPYEPYNTPCRETCGWLHSVLNWRVFALEEIPPAETMKSYLHTQGPIAVAMNTGHGDSWYSEFNGYDGSYTLHYDGPGQVNHAVLVVGWDDTLSHAGGQGAWIVKNSWGSSWGGPCGYGAEEGYFTIAYGSARIGYYASFVEEWQPYDPKGELMFYDEAGYYFHVGYGTTTAWGMCKFVPDEDVVLRRVEFWSTDATTDVDVYLYDDFDGSSLSNLLGGSLNHAFGEMGYHSVNPAYPDTITSGDDIYIVVKITNASFTYPLTLDPGSLGPRAPGMCYRGSNGTTWYECTDGDLGIRLRVSKVYAKHTWYVPGDFPAIAHAVAVADDGDTIIVAPGTYTEGGIRVESDLIVRSEAGPESTLIAAGGACPTVLTFEGCGRAACLDGFTLKGAYGITGGAGLAIDGSAVRIHHCIVADNAVASGSGIAIANSTPTITQCTVYGTSGSSGISYDASSGGTLSRCIISTTTGGPGIMCGIGGGPDVSGCDIYGNDGGDAVCGNDLGDNIHGDPRFCDAAGGDFRLFAVSPCVARVGRAQIGALGIGCGRRPVRFDEGPAIGPVLESGQPDIGSNAEGAILDVGHGTRGSRVEVRFRVSGCGLTQVAVYDVRGRCVRSLVDGYLPQGLHTHTWDGLDEQDRQVASGLYFIRLQSADQVAVERIAILR